MKIVIYVDYSNKEFQEDFKISNMLIERGHNVFLAVNDVQFEYLRSKCDISYLGKSTLHKKINYPNIEDVNYIK